jgi:hemoglobin
LPLRRIHPDRDWETRAMQTRDDIPAPLDSNAVEAAIERCVRRFYAGANADPLLGPVMMGAIGDFEAHIAIVCDFWSHVLLGTNRYQGPAYPAHVDLPIRPEHFDRWLVIFAEATTAELAPVHAKKAMDKARHMAKSFMAGMFPFEGLDGREMLRPQVVLATWEPGRK